MEASCNACFYWMEFAPAEDGDGSESDAIGTCRRYPPVFFVENNAMFESNARLPQPANTPRQWQQPTTGNLDWCGEFKPYATHPKD